MLNNVNNVPKSCWIALLPAASTMILNFVCVVLYAFNIVSIVTVASAMGVLLGTLVGSIVLASVFLGGRAGAEARRSRAFSRVGRLLPAGVRDEYCEEWAAWMADMRVNGTPRIQRWLELLSLALVAVPKLAVSLRWASMRRAVER